MRSFAFRAGAIAVVVAAGCSEDNNTHRRDDDNDGGGGSSSSLNGGNGGSGNTGNDGGDGGTGGADCDADQLLCGEACIDPLTDEQHCGASGDCAGANAGAVCAPPTEECNGGMCGCALGFVECEGNCIDPMTDNEHCGATGNCMDANAGEECSPLRPCDDGICGTPVNMASFPVVIPGATVGVTDLALAPNGDIFASSGIAHRVYRISPQTGMLQQITPADVGTTQLVAIVYRPIDGLIYVGNDLGQIFSVDPASGNSNLVASLAAGNDVNALVIAPAGFGALGGQLIAACNLGLFAVDPANPTMPTTIVPTVNFSDLVFSSTGVLYAVQNSPVVSTVASNGAMVPIVQGGIESFDGIEIDEIGDRLFLANSGGDIIEQVAIAGGQPIVIGPRDFDSGFWVAGLYWDGSATLLMATGESSLTIEAIQPQL